MKHFLRKLHLWLSIPFGLLISLICLSGALLIVEKDVVRRSDRTLLYVVPDGQPMELAALCVKILSEQPEGAKISGITIYPDVNRSYEVSIAKPHRRNLLVDQYRGVVLGEYKRSPFFESVSLLHRRMLDSSKGGKVGKQVVGVTVLCFVVILISGVVLWWPKRWRAVRRSLRIRFGRGVRVLMYDLHVTLGVFATLFLLGCSITGLSWVYDWFEKPLYSLLGAEAPMEKIQHAKVKGIGEDYEAWGQAVGAIPINEYAAVDIRKGEIRANLVGWGNNRATDDYYFDRSTGKITEVIPYVDKSRYEKVKGWISTIHLGRWGGGFSRWLTFLVMLMGASLPLTGYYLWWNRLCKTKK